MEFGDMKMNLIEDSIFKSLNEEYIKDAFNEVSWISPFENLYLKIIKPNFLLFLWFLFIGIFLLYRFLNNKKKNKKEKVIQSENDDKFEVVEDISNDTENSEFVLPDELDDKRNATTELSKAYNKMFM